MHYLFVIQLTIASTLLSFYNDSSIKIVLLYIDCKTNMPCTQCVKTKACYVLYLSQIHIILAVMAWGSRRFEYDFLKEFHEYSWMSFAIDIMSYRNLSWQKSPQPKSSFIYITYLFYSEWNRVLLSSRHCCPVKYRETLLLRHLLRIKMCDRYSMKMTENLFY